MKLGGWDDGITGGWDGMAEERGEEKGADKRRTRGGMVDLDGGDGDGSLSALSVLTDRCLQAVYVLFAFNSLAYLVNEHGRGSQRREHGQHRCGEGDVGSEL